MRSCAGSPRRQTPKQHARKESRSLARCCWPSGTWYRVHRSALRRGVTRRRWTFSRLWVRQTKPWLRKVAQGLVQTWTSRLHSGLEYFHWSVPLPKFEECLDRLEKIVTEIEKGEIPLERAL